MPEKNRNRGKIMKRRECASLIILALAAVPALLVAIGQVYVTRDQAQKNGDHRPSDGDRGAVLFISVHDLEN